MESFSGFLLFLLTTHVRPPRRSWVRVVPETLDSGVPSPSGWRLMCCSFRLLRSRDFYGLQQTRRVLDGQPSVWQPHTRVTCLLLYVIIRFPWIGSHCVLYLPFLVFNLDEEGEDVGQTGLRKPLNPIPHVTTPLTSLTLLSLYKGSLYLTGPGLTRWRPTRHQRTQYPMCVPDRQHWRQGTRGFHPKNKVVTLVTDVSTPEDRDDGHQGPPGRLPVGWP